MSSFIKGLALFIAVASFTWLAVIVRWEMTDRQVDTPDFVLYLVVLPLLLFALVLLARAAWRAAQRRAAAAAAAPGPAAAGTAAPAVPTQEDQERRLTRQLIGTHLRVNAGASASEVASALREGKVRPQPAADLLDDDGLPIICARIDDLDVEAVCSAAEPALAAVRRQQDGWAAFEPSQALWRSLAALADPLDAALAGLQPWAGPLGLAADDEAGANEAADAAVGLPLVRLLVGLGEGRSEPELALARAWAAERCAEAGLPAARLTVQAVAAAAPALWQRVDAMLVALHREARRDLLIVAAAHSDLDDDSLRQLSDAQRLYRSGRAPKGLMPGEGAAALVLAPHDWPAPPGDDTPVAHLHRMALAVRDKPVDEPGRIGSAELQRALGDALAGARLDAKALAACVADADQHTARAGEWFGAVLATAGELDAAEDVVAAGAALGHLGAVGSLVALALAADRARRDDKPVLAAALADRVGRLAWVVRPAAPPAAGADAAAAPAAGPSNRAA